MGSAKAGGLAPAAAPRPRSERATIVLALVGTALTTLALWVVLGYLGPLFQILYGLWGLLGLILAIVGLVALFAAFMAFLLTSRRAEPRFEAGASIDSLETKQL